MNYLPQKLDLPQIFRKPAAFLLAVSLSAGLILTSCHSSSISPGPLSLMTRQAEKTTSDQEAFDQLTDKIFYDNVNPSIIDLHYTLIEPESMNIAPPDSPYGTFSLEEMQRETEKLKVYARELASIRRGNLNGNLSGD